jgi:hypothetical protein
MKVWTSSSMLSIPVAALICDAAQCEILPLRSQCPHHQNPQAGTSISGRNKQRQQTDPRPTRMLTWA